MKRKKTIFTLLSVSIALVIALIIGLVVLQNQGNKELVLDGIWIDGAGSEYIFDHGNWEIRSMGIFGTRGTYTTENGTITMEISGVYLDGEWEDYTDVSQTGTYLITGNTLSITFDGETRVFTRK